jgi:hypothetical protein
MSAIARIATRLGWLAIVVAATVSDSAIGSDRLQYNRDIRPVLADNCFRCHGPDSAARAADLRVDQREAAVAQGAIVPGDVEQSELVRRITSTDPDEIMPPPDSRKELTAAQKEVLKQWIAEGAEYQLHWSFLPPVRPALPTVKDASWVRNPIDHFILAKLESAGLAPAPPADRRTLARRVSLDLIGLPPAPAIVERFVQDPSPEAYERLVDELFASPHWGEHRGRYWLDYARYADTHGIHFDNFREIWSYRDWVIQAFNDNMPFDQFTRVSLAGDLLPNPTLEQLVGSGFNRCQMTTNEGGIIDEEYLVLYTRDRTETVSRVWLGLTANCAVCHDHKFDPLSQREFYEMAAFFNNTTQGARDGNIKDSPPVIVVPQPADRARWEALQQATPAAQKLVEERKNSARSVFDDWLTQARPEVFTAKIPNDGLHLSAPLNEGSGDVLHVTVDGQPREVALGKPVVWQTGQVAPHAVEVAAGGLGEWPEVGDFEKDQPFACSAWIKLAANDSNGAVVARMDNASGHRGWDLWVEGRRIGTHIIHQWSNDAIKVVSSKQVPANQWAHVMVTYDGSQKAAGVSVYIDGEVQPTNVQADSLKNTVRTAVPFKIGQRHTSEPIVGAVLQDVRVYRRLLAPAEVATLARSSRFAAIVAKPVEQRTDAERNELFEWWLANLDESYRTLTEKLSGLQREESDIRGRGTIAYVTQEGSEPPTAYVLNRGEYDKRGQQVSPETPDVLPAFPAHLPRNRLGYAEWLLLPEHPLTARVTVNRCWQEVFGTGIVKTSGDFGVSGELPVHPELLDWLAVEFRESGWDLRRLFRLLVTSAAYCQSAATTPAKLELDPENRWLSRGPRFRMDAEMVRDYALAASGLLVPKIGGPSVKPYQPDGVWEAIAMNVSNTRSYERDRGEGLYRRSLYTFWKRMAPPASLDTFNAPSREFCVVRRERTNTPLQALVTLNDEQFVEAARQLAQRALSVPGARSEDRLQYVAAHLLARSLNQEELAVASSSLSELQNYYGAHAEDAVQLLSFGESEPDPSLAKAELAAWTMLTNELMNLDEVLNK